MTDFQKYYLDCYTAKEASILALPRFIYQNLSKPIAERLVKFGKNIINGGSNPNTVPTNGDSNSNTAHIKVKTCYDLLKESRYKQDPDYQKYGKVWEEYLKRRSKQKQNNAVPATQGQAQGAAGITTPAIQGASQGLRNTLTKIYNQFGQSVGQGVRNAANSLNSSGKGVGQGLKSAVGQNSPQAMGSRQFNTPGNYLKPPYQFN
jgi:hypothetical protein